MENYDRVLSLCMSDEWTSNTKLKFFQAEEDTEFHEDFGRQSKEFSASLKMQILHSMLLLTGTDHSALWISVSLTHTEEFFPDVDLKITVKTQHYELNHKYLLKTNMLKAWSPASGNKILISSMDQLNACQEMESDWRKSIAVVQPRPCPWPLTLPLPVSCLHEVSHFAPSKLFRRDILSYHM